MINTPRTEHPWGQAKLILFRFAFVYLVLYNWPFRFFDIWPAIVPWAGASFFHISITHHPTGSGDTAYDYMLVFCFLILAIAITLIWSILDRRRSNYSRLHDWLKVLLRFTLAMALISYGAQKVIKVQFPNPSLGRLTEPYGNSSPMGLLWTFMGASIGYNIFTGAAEMLGGLLLGFRRTVLLGALVSFAVTSHIVALNFCYDVPVKLYSSHLLLMSLCLIAPDLQRLADFFLFNRTVEPIVPRPLFERRWLHLGAVFLGAIFILRFTVHIVLEAKEVREAHGDLASKPPFYGIWNVETFAADGTIRPPLSTDKTRWHQVIVNYPETLEIRFLGDAESQRYSSRFEEKTHRLFLTRRDDPKWNSDFALEQTGVGQLALKGTYEDKPIRVSLRRMDEPNFQLLNRGFHWVSEYPYNR